MKRMISSLAIGAMVLGTVALIGTSAASAAAAPTIVLSGGKAIIGQGPAAITATTSVAGSVTFTAAGSAITGCSAVATTTTSPFVALCATFAPTAPGAVILDATLTPTDTTLAPVTAPAYTVNVALPVQGLAGSTLPLYVDTIVASGNYAKNIAPVYGGCQITNEFFVGQTVVFRAYGWAADGTALTPANVSSATVTIQGVATPLAMSFANHGATNTVGNPSAAGDGVAFWTAPLATGGTGYATLGIIPYTVTFKTIAVPAVTKKVSAVKYVAVKSKGKVVKVAGKPVYKKVSYSTTVIVTPAVAGATATFTPSFNASSSATLNAAPTS
ncbi:MAG: hypothetical protein ACRDV0_05125 [Acidimicrobiales bacterium]